MNKNIINQMLDDLYRALEVCENDEREIIVDDISRLKSCERLTS